MTILDKNIIYTNIIPKNKKCVNVDVYYLFNTSVKMA